MTRFPFFSLSSSVFIFLFFFVYYCEGLLHVKMLLHSAASHLRDNTNQPTTIKSGDLTLFLRHWSFRIKHVMHMENCDKKAY